MDKQKKVQTKKYGILGYPVAHSLSPRLHNAAFAFHHLDATYIPFPLSQTNSSTKQELLNLDFCGLSVTIPHKLWAAQMANKKDSLSQCCGAANTLVAIDGKWHAYNTDGPGALAALSQHIENITDKRFLLLGYGGSATAIAHALLLEQIPSRLVVCGRNPHKCSDFVAGLRSKHPQTKCLISWVNSKAHLELEQISHETDIIIHTTPLGMQGKPQDLPLPVHCIRKSHWVFDIVYTPQLTPLIQAAKHQGAQIIYGYFMLLHQACLQFEIFTGKTAPCELMQEELLAGLSQ